MIRLAMASEEELVGSLRSGRGGIVRCRRTQGLVGLVLLIGALATALVHLYRSNADTFIKLNIVYVTITVLSYGMLHNPLLHETTIAGIFLYLGVLMAHTSRNRTLVHCKVTGTSERRETRRI
ncbi:MAG: hypothetical protein ABW191_00415 [Aliihoeflea sp.]